MIQRVKIPKERLLTSHLTDRRLLPAIACDSDLVHLHQDRSAFMIKLLLHLLTFHKLCP